MQISEVVSLCQRYFLGKEESIKLCLAAMIAQGNILLEDVPGVGKTTLVKLMAKVFNLELSRIQFTNDILPADILGGNIFDRESSSFKFKQGPIFSQLVLADELNRASPRTQSALLQAMEEKQVTIDGQTYNLPTPFIVFATQNPRSQIGTNALPESQVDRFMLKLAIGFPGRDDEKNLLMGEDRVKSIMQLKTAWSANELEAFLLASKKVHIADDLINYVIDLLAYSRSHSEMNSLGPRAGQDILKLAQTWSFIQGKDYVTADTIQFLAPYVFSHRLSASSKIQLDSDDRLVNQLLNEVVIA
jgi:MoxR-like ATPase